jgi:hypothetical protein
MSEKDFSPHEAQSKCIQVTQSKRNEIRNQIKMIEKTFSKDKSAETKKHFYSADTPI